MAQGWKFVPMTDTEEIRGKERGWLLAQLIDVQLGIIACRELLGCPAVQEDMSEQLGGLHQARERLLAELGEP